MNKKLKRKINNDYNSLNLKNIEENDSDIAFYSIL